MGQYATLYRLDKEAFDQFVSDRKNVDISSIAKEYITLQKSHEGLRYVLSKGQSQEREALVSEMFYPSSDAGEEFDFEKELLENPDFDFDDLPVPYNDPAKVNSINSLLEVVSDEEFLANFDPEELNREGIYPGVWNREKGKDIAFNEEKILLEFQNLKSFFNNAKKEGDFVLSYVG